MDDLKLVAQALRLDVGSPIDKILEALSAVQKRASEADFWEGEAKDNLEKMEKTDRLFRENKELRVKAFYAEAVRDQKIDKAEADVMEAQQLAGRITEEAAIAIVGAKRKGDYLVRKSSLNAKQAPSDPLGEIESRANELIAKSGGKLSKSDAHTQVLSADPDLAERYRLATVKGAGGAD